MCHYKPLTKQLHNCVTDTECWNTLKTKLYSFSKTNMGGFFFQYVVVISSKNLPDLN